MFTVEKMRTENKLLTYSFPKATREDSCPQVTEEDSCPRATEADSCPRATRENSWRQQPRELRLEHGKTTHIPKKTTSGQTKIHKRECQQRTT